MRKVSASAMIAALLWVLAAPLSAQTSPPMSTREGTDAAGWSGPCDSMWETSGFRFEVLRVCRVVTYLVSALERTPLDPATARNVANQLFRVCWGDFPRSGGQCAVSNAWAMPRSWTLSAKGPKSPVVITLQAAGDLQSDDEVAFILSHEMGHAMDAKQTVEQSRQNEEHADAIGIGVIMRAGYDARSAGRGLQMIVGERGKGLLGNLAGMLGHAGDGADVHGLTGNRILLMKQTFTKACEQLGNRPIGCKAGWN